MKVPQIILQEKPDYERLVSVLWREEPDRVPFYEHSVDAEVIEYFLGVKLRGMDLSKRENKVKYLKYTVKFYKGLRYDCVPFEVGLNLPKNNVISTKDTALLSRGTRTWTDEYRGVIESIEDYESYPWPDVENLLDYELFEILSKLLPENMGVAGGTGGGILEHTMQLIGYVPFFKALYRNRKLVELVFDKVGRLITEAMKIIAEYDKVVVLRNGDDWGMRTGIFISPQLMRKYVFPWYREIVETAHKQGKPYILHSCGNLKAVMKDIIEIGVDGKHSYEDAIMPVTEVKKIYGDKIAVIGGIDVDKLARYPVDKFTEYVKNIIRECCPGGGYALGSGNTITNYSRIENYLAMLELGVKYGKYPR